MESRVCCVLAPFQELLLNRNLTGSGSKYRENTLKIEASDSGFLRSYKVYPILKSYLSFCIVMVIDMI